MTKQQQIDELTRRVKLLEETLEQRNAQLTALEDRLAEKLWPTELAVENFEHAILVASKNLLGNLRKTSAPQT